MDQDDDLPRLANVLLHGVMIVAILGAVGIWTIVWAARWARERVRD